MRRFQSLRKAMIAQSLANNSDAKKMEEEDVIIYRRKDLDRKVPNCLCLPGKCRTLAEDLLRRIFGISNPDVHLSLPGSRIIHPFSPFSATLELISCFLLVYCMCVVPVQLSFWKDIGPCEKLPTLEWDMWVDVFFLVEILLRFFIGVERNGKYVDDIKMVALYYSTGLSGFWFDMFTSVPLSWVDWSILQSCMDSPDQEANDTFKDAKSIRIVKTLRILKLGRLLKAVKLFSILSERLDISPSRMRLIKLFFILFGAMHIFACFFWRVKSDYQTDEEIETWIQGRGTTTKDTSGLYMMCFYYVCTVFTTVGFGDIFPICLEERIFAVFMMCTAACVFGLILGELQEIYAASNMKTREMEDHLESVMLFLQENSVPKVTESRVKSWIRFQYPQQRREEQSKTIMDSLPQMLRRDFACTMNRGLFSKVFLWSRIPRVPHDLKDDFAADLLLQMHTSFHLARDTIASHKSSANRLLLVVSGSVNILQPGTSITTERGQPGHLLTIGPGMSIGDNAVLGDGRWGGLYGIEADFVAQENCKICSIASDYIQEVVQSTHAYAPIRRLFEDLAFRLEDAFRDELTAVVHSSPLQEDITDDDAAAAACQTKMMKVQWAVFHWIRLARLGLHSAFPRSP